MKETPQHRSTLPVQIAKTGYILLALILCALGVVLITQPQFSIEKFRVICGVVFMAMGGVRLVGFYAKDLYRLAFQYDFEFGILLLIFGGFLLIRPRGFTSVTCVALGILVLADALFKIRITLDAKKFGVETWLFLLIIAIAVAVLGGILVFYFGKDLYIVLGITLIAEGVLCLSTALALVKIIRHQLREQTAGPDISDREFPQR